MSPALTALLLAAQQPPVPPPSTIPALPPAVIDNSLTIGGSDIAARMLRTRMTVAVGVDGRGPFQFVVDSGADSSVVGAGIAARLRLPAGKPAMLHGVTESSMVERVTVGALTLGQSSFHDLLLPVLREQDIGADGLIGIDALVEQRLMMDFEKRIITVEDARRPLPRFDGEIVVTARRRRGQLILTEASAAGRPVNAVIDTGSEITIGNMALRQRLIRNNARKFQPVEVTGVTGAVLRLEVARIGELRVGPVILRNVPMAFADVPPFALFGLGDAPAVMLGSDFLEKFRRVALDFRARRVRFQLRRCGPTSVRIGTSQAISRISLGDASEELCRR